MGIRAAQAGALTHAFDRESPEDHPAMIDLSATAHFRTLAKEIGGLDRYGGPSLRVFVDRMATFVLGAKNRTELREASPRRARPARPRAHRTHRHRRVHKLTF
jgi:hypothetical protein